METPQKLKRQNPSVVKQETQTGISEENHVLEFQLERYKYILQEIHTLNDSIHKYLTLFQTLATAVIGGGISIFVSWKSLKIDPAIAKAGLQALLGLLIILTVFVMISIIANIFSWFDYRREEVELLDRIAKSNFRKPPSFRNLWRWSETYVLLFILIMVMIVFFFVEYGAIPLIK